MDETRGIHVADPSALRALANPLRLQILGSLRTEGAQSVGALGGRLGAAPGSISYHLGTLARHGFVEEAPELARDGRERWWRATADTTTFTPAELQHDPAQRDAAHAMRQTFVQLYAADQLAYLETESTLDDDWIAAATMGDDMPWLTASELRELSDELVALAARWHARSDRDRPDAAPVRVIYSAFRRP
ncbi:helix-turn-helix domain-containing protein [Microbacterium sp. SYP-A9085]|jgi:DNA-binding transcriptional ArsR family regulator|uniref:ArsR/SmtB family transcription factor n=1 Tax=Microbacterium sp. SYP-A9085 TaxID=2664454 RepID=UPI00129A22C8|nr:winged helix-turn-helix domain-containing protein [Microbacterium sp. SYP-A9085]MRH27838.1 helix-turn-helix domain-containing protein [Microbacterium sp. SYP-A9085]